MRRVYANHFSDFALTNLLMQETCHGFIKHTASVSIKLHIHPTSPVCDGHQSSKVFRLEVNNRVMALDTKP